MLLANGMIKNSVTNMDGLVPVRVFMAILG